MTGPAPRRPKTCRKKCYRTYSDAERALLDARLDQTFRAGRTRRRECRAYVCRQCAAWHLTSIPPDLQKGQTA